MKLGQMLAMRSEVCSRSPTATSWSSCSTASSPSDTTRFARSWSRELGAPPEAVYASFEPRSFAAASIGQVHRATLQTGERVAVKVQRPGIRQALEADIELMYSFAFVFDRLRLFGATRSRAVIDEFARWTADELDYLVEARQATSCTTTHGADGSSGSRASIAATRLRACSRPS